MTFQVRSERRPATNGLDGTVYVLEGPEARAEVWPAHGFNCYRWQATCAGKPRELLYTNDTFFDEIRPTRGGIPVLFPFPNRIRDGAFTWQGKDYRLETNDPSGKNAIHGFACRHPWRVIDQGGDAASAWLTGAFDTMPEERSRWPGDYGIRLTVRLMSDRLRLEATVGNPGRESLPFGLGYHPYFRLPSPADACQVEVPADTFWELVETLPTGQRLPVDSARDLTKPRAFAGLTLDDVLALRTDRPKNAEGLSYCGQLRQGDVVLQMWADAAFRELVVFTPPHRQAFCLEPYTCLTDALNLQARGIDAGLRQLAPGQTWTGVVEMEVGKA